MDPVEKWFRTRKKYDRHLLGWGCFLALFPLYKGLGWLYITNITHPDASFPEMVISYQKDILFGIFGQEYPAEIYGSLVFLLIGIIAWALLTLSVLNSFLIDRKPALKDYMTRTVKIVLWFINFLFTFWILWGLM